MINSEKVEGTEIGQQKGKTDYRVLRCKAGEEY